MLLKTHRAVNLAVVTGLAVTAHEPVTFTMLVVAVFGTALPDIDTPASFLGRHFRFISNNLDHRGLTHSIYAVIILALLYVLFPSPTMNIFILCYGLHLVEDLFSVGGINFLEVHTPVTMPLTYHVGGSLETMVRWIALGFLAYNMFLAWFINNGFM